MTAPTKGCQDVTTTDYSKPVGWWCSTRGATWRSTRHHAEECWGDVPCLVTLIPVYLPLPVTETVSKTEKTPRGKQGAIPSFTPLAVPEVTTWGASGGEDALCCEYLERIGGHGGGGVLDYSLGSDVWRERAISVYDDGEVLVHDPMDELGASFVYKPCKDIASAIRFAEQPTRIT